MAEVYLNGTDITSIANPQPMHPAPGHGTSMDRRPNSTTTMHNQPQFFIVRSRSAGSPESGRGPARESTIVPLIPVDLLPKWVSIQGVPHQLSLEDTVGMTNLGTFGPSDVVLGLRFGNLDNGKSPAVSESSLLDECDAQGASGSVPADGKQVRNLATLSPSHATGQRNMEDLASPSRAAGPSMLSHCSADTNNGHTVRSDTPRHARMESTSPAPTVPKYCQAWCHHGFCPRGRDCRYRHKMPKTARGLTEVGLRAVPLWYRIRGGRHLANHCIGHDLAGDHHHLKAGMTNPRGGKMPEGERAHEEANAGLQDATKGLGKLGIEEAGADGDVPDREAAESSRVEPWLVDI